MFTYFTMIRLPNPILHNNRFRPAINHVASPPKQYIISSEWLQSSTRPAQIPHSTSNIRCYLSVSFPFRSDRLRCQRVGPMERVRHTLRPRNDVPQPDGPTETAKRWQALSVAGAEAGLPGNGLPSDEEPSSGGAPGWVQFLYARIQKFIITFSA